MADPTIHDRIYAEIIALSGQMGTAKSRGEAIISRLDTMNGTTLRNEARIRKLEGWRWMIVGGFSVIVFGLSAVGALAFLVQ